MGMKVNNTRGMKVNNTRDGHECKYGNESK